MTAGGGPHFSGDQLDVQTANIQTANIQNLNVLIPRAYTPPGGFAKWGAAKSRAIAGQGTATMMGIGASIVAGGTAVTDMLTKPYFALQRGRLTAANPAVPVGDSFLSTASTSYQSGSTYSVAPFTHDVSALSYQFFGPFTCPVWSTQTTIPLFHYTHPSTALGYNARSLRFFYFDLGNQDGGASGVGRTFSVNVDGAGTQNITLLGDNLIHVVDFTSLSNTSGHVLNVGNQGAASIAVVPIAVASYSTTTIPTTGFHFAWFGQNGGWCMGDFARQDGTYPAARIERVIGPSNAAAPFTANSALNPPFAPDLAILDIFDDINFVATAGTISAATPNFTVGGLPADAYLAGLRRLLDALSQKATGCDVVHHMPNLPAGVVSDVNPGATNLLQNAYHFYAQQWTVAYEFGHGWLNTHAEWGQRGLALGFLNAGNGHPNNSGMADIDSRFNSRLALP